MNTYLLRHPASIYYLIGHILAHHKFHKSLNRILSAFLFIINFTSFHFIKINHESLVLIFRSLYKFFHFQSNLIITDNTICKTCKYSTHKYFINLTFYGCFIDILICFLEFFYLQFHYKNYQRKINCLKQLLFYQLYVLVHVL